VTPDLVTRSEDTVGPDRSLAGVGPRWRKVLVYVLAVLTCFSVLASSVGVWAHRTLLNTNSWVNAVGPLASDPAITDAVAKEVTTQLLTVINAQQLAADALPDKAKVLAPPLTEAVGSFVERTVAELMRNQQFRDFWVAANQRIHPVIVKVLRGDTKAVRTDNGTVRLNLLPLIGQALGFVQQKAPGLLGGVGTIPKITFDTPVDQAQEQLATALGRTIPADFGVITVFQSDKLKAAQDAVALFDKVTVGLLVGTLLVLVATIALALDRRRILIVLGLGIAVAIALAVAVINALKGQLLGLIGDREARAAAGKTVTVLVARLHLITDLLVAVGLAVALIAFLTGSSRAAVAVRRGATRLGRSLTGAVEVSEQPAALRWIKAHAVEARWVVAAGGVLVLLFLVDGWSGLFLTLLGVGLIEVGLGYLASSSSTASAKTSV
jgi:hypothetical protein